MKIFITYISNNGIDYIDLLKQFDKFVGGSTQKCVDADYNNLKNLDCREQSKYGFLKVNCKKENGRLNYVNLPFNCKKEYCAPIFVSQTIHYK